MASKPETQFYTVVHKHLPDSVYRMKTHNPYMGGIPDVWYSARGGDDLWVEYKYLPRNPARTVVSPLKLLLSLQADWLRERHIEGRSVGVIIGCPAGGVALPGLTWEHDLPAKEFMSRVKTRKELAEWITALLFSTTR